MKKTSWLLVTLLAVTIINYPNPFSPKTGQTATLEATSDATVEATLTIYDLAARLVLQKTFNLATGTSRLAWNGYDNNNDLAGNGVYLYRLISQADKQLLARGKIWVINR